MNLSANDWRTDAEKSEYRVTPRYAESIAWLERLAAATDQLRIEDFGISPEGRPLKIVIASADHSFTPQLARERGKLVFLVQAGIHPGEIEGKDAGMELLRDLTVGGKHPGLFDRVVMVFIPVFNVDGHERMSRFSRVNQNGPEEMGWRGTAQNLNLNRDYIKADAPEMRAWLALWNRWSPDLFMDVHTTNGADYQYDLTWYLEEWGSQDESIRNWQREALIGRVFPATDGHGHVLGPYINLIDQRDIRKGLVNFGSGPRFSTGYVALRGRPGILVETHMLKPYAQRVRATYALWLELLRELKNHGGKLRQAVDRADVARSARAAGDSADVAIAFKPTDVAETFTLKGVASSTQHSDISGAPWVTYEPAKPIEFEVPFHRAMVPAVSVRPPAAYVVRASATEAIARVQAHGLEFTTISAPVTLEVEGWRIEDPQWASAPFEGRIVLRSFRPVSVRRKQTLAPGSIVIALDQSAANVALQLLEPGAPDSLLRWGLFNAVFELKEYADARKIEQIARDMLADDPRLRDEFDARLKDPVFAGDPAARLAFFFSRSAWADPELGVLPVFRLERDVLEQLRSAERGRAGRSSGR